jgi:hypothetical protein
VIVDHQVNLDLVGALQAVLEPGSSIPGTVYLILSDSNA